MKLTYIFILLIFCSTAYADLGKYDFGDNKSETLTAKAWDALIEKDYDAVLAYAKRCVSLYESRAKTQQNLLEELPKGDDVFQYWALNDVGTCYYLIGEAYCAKKKYELAKRAYRKVIKKLPFAQCYDPAGYHVKVAVSCEKKLVVLDIMMSQDFLSGHEEESPQGSKLEKIDIREKLKEFDKTKDSIKQK